MKKLFTLYIAVLLIATSCNNPASKAPEAKPADTTAAKPAMTKPVFKPYNARMIEITVKDFDKWYDHFKSSDTVYSSFGLTNAGVGRETGNDKKVIIFATMADLQRAKDYGNSAIRKDLMKKSGVVSAGTATYWNVIMDDTTHIAQQQRLMVTHHVKDFDTWKKAFDAEGDSARGTYGLIERAMARGLEDANTVTILFAVTDMDKAKARVASAELKKIMTDAGVDSAPQITWFSWVNN